MAITGINDDGAKMGTVTYFLRELVNRLPPLAESDNQRVRQFGNWALATIGPMLAETESIVAEIKGQELTKK